VTEPAATATLLAAIGILLALAGLASPLSGRFGVPALLIFLALGIANTQTSSPGTSSVLPCGAMTSLP
jgi:NhaP-type Na+/H+ and K+/H+ antiporter